MTNPGQPAFLAQGDMFYLGCATKLVDISVLSRGWGMELGSVRRMLRSLSIPVGKIGDKYYFNLVTLEMVVFHLLDVGMDDFTIPILERSWKDDKCVKLSKTLCDELRDPESPLHALRALSALSRAQGERGEVIRKLEVLSGVLLKASRTRHKVREVQITPDQEPPDEYE